MSYNHSLTTTVHVKEGVRLTQVIEALEPLLTYLGYNGNQVFLGEHKHGDHTFIYDSASGELHIYTCGDVSFDFYQIISSTADRLGPLVLEASDFELRNYDTAELENAILHIFYGPTKKSIEEYAYAHHRDIALYHLGNHFDRSEVMLIGHLIAARRHIRQGNSGYRGLLDIVEHIAQLLEIGNALFSKLSRHDLDMVIESHEEALTMGHSLHYNSKIANELVKCLSMQSSFSPSVKDAQDIDSIHHHSFEHVQPMLTCVNDEENTVNANYPIPSTAHIQVNAEQILIDLTSAQHINEPGPRIVIERHVSQRKCFVHSHISGNEVLAMKLTDDGSINTELG